MLQRMREEAAGERIAVVRQILRLALRDQPAALEEFEPALDLADHVARDLGLAADEPQALDPLARVTHRPGRDLADRPRVEADRARCRIQPRAVAVGAGLVADAFDLGLLRR